MTIFDQFALNIFNHYKPRLKRKANTITVFYISLLQSALLLLFGVFFSEFFKQMKVNTMSSSNAWMLFVIAIVIIYFKNWRNLFFIIICIVNLHYLLCIFYEFNPILTIYSKKCNQLNLTVRVQAPAL